MAARRLESRIHPDDRGDPGKTGPQVMRHVIVNVAESPIAWLASRGMLTPEQLQAGERLRADYERAGLAARVTMRWDAAPPANHRMPPITVRASSSLPLNDSQPGCGV